jgi:sugar lactone lactonase YvrE
VFPHGATVDHEGNLWVADARGNDVAWPSSDQI